MKLTLRELFYTHKTLLSYSAPDHERTISYTFKLAHNLVLLEQILYPYMRAIEQAKQASSKFVEYNMKRLEIIHKYATYNSDGSICVDSSNKVLIRKDKQNEFYEELHNLRNEYRSIIQNRYNQLREVDKLLDEIVDLDTSQFELIEMDELPKSIPEQPMKALIKLGFIKI